MQIGKLTQLALNIDTPLKMDSSVDYNNGINIMVGQNGTGKTLVLKLNFALGTIMAIEIANSRTAQNYKAPERAMKWKEVPESFNIEKLAQYVFDNTFTDQNFNGTIEAKWEKGSLSLDINTGTVILAIAKYGPEIDTPTPVIFMSSEFRTFDAINQYFKIKAKCETDEEMLQFFKLYDLMYCKMLQQRIGESYEIPEPIQEALTGMMGEKWDIKSLSCKSDGFYFTRENGEERNCASLSKGEQAILNMMLGAGG